MRLWVRPGVRINLSLGFSRDVWKAPNTSNMRCFPDCWTLSPVNLIPGSACLVSVKKKRNLFPGLLPPFSEFTCVAALRKDVLWQTPPNPHPGSGILTWFPFDIWHKLFHPCPFETEFPYLLGSTHPCPTAVHMEPFSTSVFKVLIWIFATTTKICTRVCFIRIRILDCTANTTPSYSSKY